jgi:hypothetical protein
MSKQIKIERITCNCGQVIAGCVHGQQDAGWDKDKRGYMIQGCEVDIIALEDFKFGKCQCEGQKTKMRLKVLAENKPEPTLFTY